MNIGLLLYIPYRELENRIMSVITEAGYDVTLAQARLLQRIGPDGTRLTELAEAAQVTKQTAGFLVDQLEKAGYVERLPDPTDGRARLVCVTEKAKGAAPVAEAEIARIEAEWERHIGKRRMAQLREALEKLGEITDPYR
ncbi:MarR family winged helix-turn-helix transcriptional regulator [Lentzea aerocolonigenes]|uniref:MarR family winged helix-turn-helix transcriptional regulator n=1 Tax=Lentzea aerocolonigenes TaxID=68170 RepID=UPI0004C33C2F|nr:MarR family transcriptional regulator [Lentzea aerocolonigenes]MCP2247531.1 DNA-binding transcriptional regulator, MarR family [Lentzea aerocolonigenes]